MSARAAQCPNCGAEVLFSAGSSLVSICGHCRASVARRGANLESIGVVAELVPTSSPFRVGMQSRGGKGVKPFRIVGRNQLSTGAGTWDEWYIAFDDGKWGWLAEAQGGFWILMPVPPPADVPAWDALKPGDTLEMGGYGRFTAVEVSEALYASAEGELPFDEEPGAVFSYADLSSADGGLATLDYGANAGTGLDAFYVGKKVELSQLGIEGLVAWKERKVAAKATALNCPSCGGALRLKDPANTVRVACTYCGAILGGRGDGVPDKFEVLERLSAVPFQPALALGSEGTLRGRTYALLGAVQKAVISDGTKYYWVEYLLKEEKSEAYHWLAESNGHYTLLEPVPAAAVEDGKRFAVYKGTRYRIFSRGKARVEAVLGEFYWAVARGETTKATDFVAPPRMLSSERANREISWTEGSYVPHEEIEAAFHPKALPSAVGVGAAQPWPHEAARPVVWRTALALAAAAVLVFIVAKVTAPHRVVFDHTYDLVDPERLLYAERGGPATAAEWGRRTAPGAAQTSPAAQQTSPGASSDWSSESTPTSITERRAKEEAEAAARVIVSEPFETTRTANMEALVWAPTDNNWVEVGISLIGEGSGEVRSFGLVSDSYHGVDDGESWSEGRQSRTQFVSRVPAGKWVARLDPESERGKAPPQFRVRLTSGVPHASHFVWTLVLIFLWPFFLVFSRLKWEGRRWAEADFSTAGERDE